jgi:hypothetical protein
MRAGGWQVRAADGAWRAEPLSPVHEQLVELVRHDIVLEGEHGGNIVSVSHLPRTLAPLQPRRAAPRPPVELRSPAELKPVRIRPH